MSLRHDRFRSRFDDGSGDPLGSMANLVDVMLVFSCGLIAALVMGKFVVSDRPPQGTVVEQGKELPELPGAAGKAGAGLQAVGRVFRDPKSGKLILVDE